MPLVCLTKRECLVAVTAKILRWNVESMSHKIVTWLATMTTVYSKRGRTQLNFISKMSKRESSKTRFLLLGQVACLHLQVWSVLPRHRRRCCAWWHSWYCIGTKCRTETKTGQATWQTMTGKEHKLLSVWCYYCYIIVVVCVVAVLFFVGFF